MDPKLLETIRLLRLPGLATRWDEYLETARKGSYSPVRLLQHVLQEEATLKRATAYQRRLQQARLPERWAMETFPFARQPTLDRKRILSIYDAFDYLGKQQNLIWLGPTGCGKTGLATSFVLQAIDRGFTGRYVLFADLVAEIFSAVADHSEHEVIERYLRYDCLLIDELGYVEVEPVQVGLFFTLMQKRHRRRPTLITSNLGFGEWRSLLKNDHLTAALIDRLTENSHVINMKHCVSLRPKLKESR